MPDPSPSKKAVYAKSIDIEMTLAFLYGRTKATTIVTVHLTSNISKPLEVRDRSLVPKDHQ